MSTFPRMNKFEISERCALKNSVSASRLIFSRCAFSAFLFNASIYSSCICSRVYFVQKSFVSEFFIFPCMPSMSKCKIYSFFPLESSAYTDSCIAISFPSSFFPLGVNVLFKEQVLFMHLFFAFSRIEILSKSILL